MKPDPQANYISEAVDYLFAAYPGATRGWDSEKHRQTQKIYGLALSRIPQGCVGEVVNKSHAAYPQWPPTAPQLSEIANKVFADWQRNNNRPQTAPPERQLEENAAPMLTEDGAADYINAGQTKYERLARLWECENRSGTLTHEKRMKRAACIMQLLDKIAA